MTAVLVVAQSPEIEALLADLVVFAGYQPVFVNDDQNVRETVRRRRVDAFLVDAALPEPHVECCENVAREESAALVYCASALSAGELREFAERRRAPYFPLPNGPKLLSSVLREALTAVGKREAASQVPPSPEFVRALRAITRARRVSTAAQVVRETNRDLRSERDALLADVRGGMNLLRRAVVDYSRTLRTDGLSRSRAAELVQAALRDGAEAAGDREMIVQISLHAQRWIDEVYCVA